MCAPFREGAYLTLASAEASPTTALPFARLSTATGMSRAAGQDNGVDAGGIVDAGPGAGSVPLSGRAEG